MQTPKDGRPRPPRDLTKTQRKHWNDIVSNEASSTFETTANQLLLAELVRHTSTAMTLAKAIDEIETIGVTAVTFKFYADLLKQRETATRCITSLARSLRLTNQSRYTPQAAATAAKGSGSSSNPWDYSG